MRRTAAKRGFTLIEALVVIAVLGLVATVVVPSIQQSPDAAKKAKLEQDIVMVNNAIDAYLAAGGSQGGLSAEGAVETLKQRVTAAVTTEMTGELGPFLDPRIFTAPSDFGWSARFVSGAQPRFVIQNTPDGVVFERGLPSAVGGPVAASKPSWLWSYAEAEAQSVSKPVFEPAAIDTGTTLGVSGSVLVGLVAPSISPASQTFDLSGFPLPVSISNPNPSGSSIVYYRIDEGSWVLWVNSPFNVNPGSTVEAVAVSIDPSRYYNSSADSETYSVTPLQLGVSIDAPASITYAQAGGSMIGQASQSPAAASVSLGVSIPAPYISSANFQIRYTTDGSDPLTSAGAQSGPAFNGSMPAVQVGLGLANWGSANSLTIRAVAVASNTAWFSSSPVAAGIVAISPTLVGAPTISPAAGRYINSFPVTITAPGSGPTGRLVFYTTNGVTPASGVGTSFSSSSTSFNLGPISFGQSRTVSAVAIGPTNYSQWFTPSGVVSAVYTGPNFNYGAITGGVLVSGGTIGNNASLRGSVVIARVTNGTQPNLTFNNNSGLTGNIFAPGTPRVVGVPTNRIVDLDGDINPTNYTVTIGSGVAFSGTVYRRITPVVMPSVTLPTGLTPRGSASSGTLLPGYYTSISANNNATLTLGVAGATNPSVYLVNSFSTGNNSRVNVVGPVVLVLNPGSSSTISIANNVVVGNSSRPDWLQVQMATGNLTLGNNGFLYGTVLAPTGTVTFQNNSTFNGAVTANSFLLNNNGAGITFSLPPPQ
jgi:prepilin-type N-terminal cleavage/methylation domain-containing protein